MFPLYSSVPRRSFPVVNYLIIVVNILIFIYLLLYPFTDSLVSKYAFIPSQFNFLILSSYLPIFTSIFIHGSVLHILSNMVFLHVFGNTIEDRLGHVRYVIFYLTGATIATLSQYLTMTSSSIPMIGASGAVSAVAGAYFILFRNSKIKTVVIIFVFLTLIDLPTWLVLGYWFLSQAFNSIGSLIFFSGTQGGIAWFAHMGGFIFGNALAYGLKRRRGKNDIIVN